MRRQVGFLREESGLERDAARPDPFRERFAQRLASREGIHEDRGLARRVAQGDQGRAQVAGERAQERFDALRQEARHGPFERGIRNLSELRLGHEKDDAVVVVAGREAVGQGEIEGRPLSSDRGTRPRGAGGRGRR